MLNSDMPVSLVLKSLKESVSSKRLLAIVAELENDIETGQHFWEAFAKTGLFPEYAISLIRIGEESGRLSENLKFLSQQQEKERILKERIKSAMIYPAIVLGLTVILGTAIAWFILPRLATVFSQLRIKLPLLTVILIRFGAFLQAHGLVFIPCFILGFFTLFYFLFIFGPTKFIGQKFLFVLPGVGTLVRETEITRFGYVLGSLLGAGVPVVQALDLLSRAASFENYKRLFAFLKNSLEEGKSFQKSFADFSGLKKMLPVPVQQIVVAGELSGKLEHSLLTIGKNYEEKSALTAQNLTVVLEPIMLIIVWIGVAMVALGVILPLYGLIGGLQDATTGSTNAPAVVSKNLLPAATSTPQTAAELKTATSSPVGPVPAIRGAFIQKPGLAIVISPGINYLYVRSRPASGSAAVGQVYPGQVFALTRQQQGWYFISPRDGTVGWVSSRYASLVR